MDFGPQDVPKPKDLQSLKREISSLVSEKFSEKTIDSRSVYSGIKDKLGVENIDDQMLNFAINSAVEEITKAKKIDKPLSAGELQRQVDLVVNWALIKIKGKNSEQIGQINSTGTKDIDFGSGGDTIVLKDFKIK